SLWCSMEPPNDPYRFEDETIWTATGHERPVFLDESGRRRRWVLAGGVFAGGVSAFWVTALIAGAVGFSRLPLIRPHLPFVALHAEAHEVAAIREETSTVRHRPVAVSTRR